jgi:hypothetical protein
MDSILNCKSDDSGKIIHLPALGAKNRMKRAYDQQVSDRRIDRRVLMMNLNRKFIYVLPYIVLAGLLFIDLAGTSFAQPDQTFSMNENREQMETTPPEGMTFHQMAGLAMGVPIEILQSGRGFALRGNESHVLRLNVETLLPLDPTQMRMLLASNKSLDEIRKDIRATEGETTYRGSLMLDRCIYPLINIAVSPLSNNSTAVGADLADFSLESSESEPAIVGSVFVIISPSNGSMVGKGELDLNQSLQSEKYAILLDMQPPRCGKGHESAEEMCR